MSIKRISGCPNIHYMPKAASTVFSLNGLVYANGSGYLIPADNTSGDHFGIGLKAVAATDDDYASATPYPVDMVGPNDILEADVPNGDLAVSDVGNTCDLDDTDPTGIDPDATSKNVVTIVGYISASKALIVVNAVAGTKNVATS